MSPAIRRRAQARRSLVRAIALPLFGCVALVLLLSLSGCSTTNADGTPDVRVAAAMMVAGIVGAVIWGRE